MVFGLAHKRKVNKLNEVLILQTDEEIIQKLTLQTVGGQSTLLKFYEKMLGENRKDIRQIELTYFALAVTGIFYLQYGQEPNKKELLDQAIHSVLSRNIFKSNGQLGIDQSLTEFKIRFSEYSNLITTLLSENSDGISIVNLFIHFYECTMQASAEDNFFDTAKVSKVISRYIIDSINFAKEEFKSKA